MNVKLLRKVAKHVLAEPKRLRMEMLRTPMDDLPENLRPPCGTACCFAGWGIVLSKLSDGFDLSWPTYKGSPVGLGEQKVDELFDTPNNKLFFTGDWPDKFRLKYHAAKRPSTKAKIAVAALEDYIKTKGWITA
jgi:hypothetical protein